MNNDFYDKEAEKCLLSMLLKNNEQVNAELTELNENYFTGAERIIFKAIQKIVSDGKTPDEMILSEYFNKLYEQFEDIPKEYNSLAGFATLNDVTFSTVNRQHYIERVKSAWEKRATQGALKIGLEAIETSNNGKETRERIISDLTAIDTQSSTRIYKNSDVMNDVIADLSEKMKPDYKRKRILTGFAQLDNLLDGLEKGSLNLIGARPSQGKTSLALSIYRNLLKRKTCAGFISLEMGEKQLGKRLVSMETGFSMWKLNNLTPTDENLKTLGAKIGVIGDSEGFIADTPNAFLSDVKSVARMLVKCKGARVLFIDYAGLISLSGELSNRPDFEKQSHISKSIKALARELDIPIFLLVQLNRDAQGKNATLANIRGSGSFEQDADTVIFIQKGDNNGKERYWLSLDKNRQGATGIVDVDFHKEITLFTDPLKQTA